MMTPKTSISIVQTNSVKQMSLTQALNPSMQWILIHTKDFCSICELIYLSIDSNKSRVGSSHQMGGKYNSQTNPLPNNSDIFSSWKSSDFISKSERPKSTDWRGVLTVELSQKQKFGLFRKFPHWNPSKHTKKQYATFCYFVVRPFCGQLLSSGSFPSTCTMSPNEEEDSTSLGLSSAL